MRAAIVAILCAVSLLAQSSQGVYTYERSASLSGAASVVTIHLPTTANRTVRFLGASVYCSVVCTFTLERDGTAPTTTAVTPAEMNGGTAGEATAYHTSNVGTSTVIKSYNVAAAEEKVIELDSKGLKLGKNLTIRTNSITGTARIFIQWQEF